jgi:hypothetical protein
MQGAVTVGTVRRYLGAHDELPPRGARAEAAIWSAGNGRVEVEPFASLSGSAQRQLGVEAERLEGSSPTDAGRPHDSTQDLGMLALPNTGA